jgi:GT2 family glycosyltransferase
MYGEDIDLSYRITSAGYKNYYLGGVTITHLKGGSTIYDKKQIDHFYRSMKIFVEKHYKGKRPTLFIWLLFAGIWLRKMIATIGLLLR